MAFAGAEWEKFSAHAWVIDWPDLVVATNALEIRLRRVGRQEAADMVIRAYARFVEQLKGLSATMSARGTEMLRKSERDSRVRPDTLGEGGKRLGHYLYAEPLMPSLLPGAIGINDEEQLDNNVPWWITNEIGSDVQVGRRIFGLFFEAGGGGGYVPDAEMRQEHPIFAPAPAGAGGGPGTIEEPIPAKGFIRSAAGDIKREWLAGFVPLKDEFDAAIKIALVTYR